MAGATFSGPRIVLSGGDSDIGGLVAAELAERGVDVVNVERGRTVTKVVFEDADSFVHLGPPTTLAPLLDVAGDAGVQQVIIASSATVYGAWPDNPMPLTEDVPLRPNPGSTFAAEFADVERRTAEWADNHPATAVAVLRFVPVLTPRHDHAPEPSVAAWFAAPSLVRTADALPALQVLHVADAASAVVHVLTERLAGTYNVAPLRSVHGDTARALATAGVPLPLPERLARRVERLAWRLRLGGVPRSEAPYREHAWVVASDRLRATGWDPAYTAEETLVACRQGSWWRELSPKRRQEVALGGAGGVAAAIAGGCVFAARAVRASRRASL